MELYEAIVEEAHAPVQHKISSPKPICQICDTTEGSLLRCSRCNVVHYCGSEHQARHWPEHKTDCAFIKKARDRALKFETNLRNADDNPFQHTGYKNVFWGRRDGGAYMESRFQHVQRLQQIDTHESVKLQLDTLLSLVNLNRGDNGGYRNLIPGLMLRLGQDQNCYDFVKFYMSTKENHDWSDPTATWLNFEGEDAFEAPTFINDNRIMVLPMVVCLLLLKIKLFLDIKILQTCGSEHAANLTQETMVLILQRVVQSNIIKAKSELAEVHDHHQTLLSLKAQMTRLYGIIDKMNKYFWPSFLKMEYPPLPMMCSPCSQAEANLVLHYTVQAIFDTPNATRVIQSLAAEYSKA